MPPGGSNQRSAVLRNTGGVPVTVSPGIPSEGFALIDPPGAVEIEPRGTLELMLVFVPPSEGLWLLELDLGAGLPPVLGRGHAAGSSGILTDRRFFHRLTVGTGLLVLVGSGDWLLASIFFLIGLEIKREILVGELIRPQDVASGQFAASIQSTDRIADRINSRIQIRESGS